MDSDNATVFIFKIKEQKSKSHISIGCFHLFKMESICINELLQNIAYL